MDNLKFCKASAVEDYPYSIFMLVCYSSDLNLQTKSNFSFVFALKSMINLEFCLLKGVLCL